MENIKRQTVFLLLMLLIHVLPTQGQKLPSYENPIILNGNRGLSVGEIRDVAVDKHGFLWVAGIHGLQRYDGHQFKLYRHDTADSTSLAGNDIRDLYYDESTNKLWIAIWKENAGLSILDLTTEKFKNYKFNPEKPDETINNGQTWVYKDKFGTFWVGYQKTGMGKYIPKTDSFKRYSYQNKIKKGTVIDAYSCYAPDAHNDSLLWIGTMDGLLKFNVVNEKFTRYTRPNSPLQLNIKTIFHHTDGQVYFGTWQKEGVVKFDPETEEFSSCKFPGYSQININPINSILSITAKSDDILRICTKAGMIEYDVQIKQVIDFKKTYEPNRFQNYFFDKKNERAILYSNSEGGEVEVAIYDPILQQLNPYIYQPENEERRFNFIVRAMIEDEKTGKLWVAAQMSEGLYRLDLKTGEWEVFFPPEYYEDKEHFFLGWDLLRTKSGKLLYLSDNHIFEFSEKEEKLIPWELEPVVDDPAFREMLQDKKGNIWIGSHKKGVFKINPIEKTIRQYRNGYFNGEAVDLRAVWELEEDRNSNIWIRSGGYAVYNYEQDTIYHFPYFFKDEKVIYHIGGINLDKEGNAVIGSSQQAIGITDADAPEKGIVDYFGKEEAMKINKAIVLFGDKAGSVWATSGGLEQIDLEKKQSNYFRSIYINKRDLASMIQLKNGNIALGHRKGISIFNPDNLKLNEKLASPYISSFKVFDKELEENFPFSETKDIYLQPGENFFSMEISALNPAFFGGVGFLYKLEGVDPDWVNPKQRNYIAYTNIESGDYTFKLKAKNGEGIWNETPYKLRIHIATAWYRTWWAYSLVTLFLLSIIYSAYGTLASRSHARKEAKRLEEMNQLKTSLYTNITHEFRTPLTVILGMTETLNEKIAQKNWDSVAKTLNMITRNGENLLQLVNEMLDLARLESGHLELEMMQSDVVSFIKYLSESFQSLAEKKQINLTVYAETEELVMDFDAQKLMVIVSNLLSNAIKFTEQGGKVIMHLRQIEEDGQDYLLMKVKDNGIGLSKEAAAQIFNRFYRVDNLHAQSGTGIGLALTKELIELMNGKIEVKSEWEKGSEFIVHLPVYKNASLATKTREIPTSIKSKLSNEATTFAENQPSESGLPLIVIMEDNHDVAHYLKNCLIEKYQVLHAVDGEEGIEMAFEKIPDLIISDVMMPKKDGFEVCKILKTDERTDHIPIILLTAKVTQKDQLTGLSHGADAYLAKPFSKVELLMRMEQLIALRQKLMQKNQSGSLHELVKQKVENPETKFLQKVIAIIHKDIDNSNLGAPHLARKLGMSESQVYRKLKATAGKSTALFIRSVRLQASKELIQTTDKSIAEVAYEVGFKDPSWFSRAFKEEFGYSPSELNK